MKVFKFILLAFLVYIILQSLNGGYYALCEYLKTLPSKAVYFQIIYTAVCSVVVAAVIAAKINELNRRINK